MGVTAQYSMHLTPVVTDTHVETEGVTIRFGETVELSQNVHSTGGKYPVYLEKQWVASDMKESATFATFNFRLQPGQKIKEALDVE